MCSSRSLIASNAIQYSFNMIQRPARERIQKHIARWPKMSVLRSCLHQSQCNDAFRQMLQFNKNLYPQYFEEIAGLASGAKVDEMDMILLSFKHEVLYLMHPDQLPDDSVQSVDKLLLECSDVHWNTDSFQGFGQNEDGWIGTADTGFFAQYHFPKKSNSDPEGSDSSRPNAFFAFQYPGSIVGHAFGVNMYGVATSMNAVFPRNVTVEARGSYFLSRALCDATNMDDVVRMVNDYEGAACAYGASINVGYHDKQTGQVSVANIEISNYEVSIEYYGPDHDKVYGYHFNQYMKLNVSQLPDPSSGHRQSRTFELMEQHEIHDMKDINRVLGDTSDRKYPLYRNGHDPDDLMTLATAVFDLGKGELYVHSKCNPMECEATHVIPFNTLRDMPSQRNRQSDKGEAKYDL